MKKLKVFLAVGLLCCGLSMSMAEAKTMTLDKTKVLVPQGFSVANDDLKFKSKLRQNRKQLILMRTGFL